ncbi:unnamed protein product [Ectocarpus sp. 4 AP-2014]
MDKAAEEGHLHVVEWLHNNRTEGGTTTAMDCAAAAGHLEVAALPAAAATGAENSGAGVIDAHVHGGDGGDDMAGAGAGAAAGADTIDGLLLAGGGGVAAVVTLDLDEAAAEGRLAVLQWARSATMDGAPSPPPPCGARHQLSLDTRLSDMPPLPPPPRLLRPAGFGKIARSSAEKEEKKEEDGDQEGFFPRDAPGGGYCCCCCDCGEEERIWRAEEKTREPEEAGVEEKDAVHNLPFLPCTGGGKGCGEDEDEPWGEEEKTPEEGGGYGVDEKEQWGEEEKRQEEAEGKRDAFPPTGGGGCCCRSSRSRLRRIHGRSGSVTLACSTAAMERTRAAVAATATASPASVPGTAAAGASAAALSSVPSRSPSGNDAAAAAATAVRCDRCCCCCCCEVDTKATPSSSVDDNGWRRRQHRCPLSTRRFYGDRGEVAASGQPRCPESRGAGDAEGLAVGAGRNRFRVAMSTDAVDRAAGNGHLEVVRWLYFHRAEGGTAGAITAAAAGGHVRVLDWLARNTPLMVTTTRRTSFFRGTSVLNPSALDRAAANGHLGVLRWFQRNNVNNGRRSDEDGFTYRLMDEAASNGHLQVCQWLRQHRSEGCSWNAFDGAAGGGHTHVLDWLDRHYHAVGPSAVAFTKAAKAGHLHVVQWLLRRHPGQARAGCMWAVQELSPNPASDLTTGGKRQVTWKVDPEVLELVRTAWDSYRTRVPWGINLRA